jgi:hypothetical protein
MDPQITWKTQMQVPKWKQQKKDLGYIPSFAQLRG